MNRFVTPVQLAWYIERDGARITRHYRDGSLEVALSTGGTVLVPADGVKELDAERDRAYRRLRDRATGTVRVAR